MNKKIMQYQIQQDQKSSKQNEPPNSENRNATQPNHRANTNTRTKSKSRKFKENYEWRKG